MPASSKIGSFRPMTFLHNGKPVRPVRPSAPDRTPGMKGIQMSGDVQFSDFVRNKELFSNLSYTELGRGAVRMQKMSGLSLNITI